MTHIQYTITKGSSNSVVTKQISMPLEQGQPPIQAIEALDRIMDPKPNADVTQLRSVEDGFTNPGAEER